MRSTSLPPCDGIGLRAPAATSPFAADAPYEGTSEPEGNGWAIGLLFCLIVLIIGAVCAAVGGTIIWFVVKVIESFV